LIVRHLKPDDSIPALTKLLHDAYARLGKMGFNCTAVDQTEETTRKRIARGDCIVALEAGDLVGTIMFYSPARSSGCPWYERANTATIGQFAVLPSQQGKGIGTLLLHEAERLTVKHGAEELALDTSEGAHHLIGWYEREGFRFVEYAKWKGKTYRSVVMSKSVVGVGNNMPREAAADGR
jgi:GNAT superfamily N-acetyltransferase